LTGRNDKKKSERKRHEAKKKIEQQKPGKKGVNSAKINKS